MRSRVRIGSSARQHVEVLASLGSGRLALLPAGVAAVGAGSAVAYSPTLTAAAVLGLASLIGAVALLVVPVERVPSTNVGCALVGMALIPVTRVGHAGTKGALAYVAAGAVLAVIALGVLRMLRSNRVSVSLSLFGVLVVAVVATAAHHDHGAWERAALTFGLLAAVSMVAGGASERDRDRCLRLVIYTAAMEALLAVLGFAGNLKPAWVGARIYADGSSAPLAGGLFGHVRQQGTLGHPLLLAFLAGVAWIVLVLQPELFKDGTRRAILVLLSLGVLLTATISVLALLPITYFVFRPRGGKAVRAAVLGIALISVVSIFLATGGFGPGITQSGSYTHRLGAIDAAKRVTGRQPLLPVLIGNGAASEPRLYAQGLLQNDGLEAVDNQYVDTVVEVGLVGLGLLALAFGTALFGATSPAIAAAMFMIVAESAVFDMLTWPSMAVLAAMFVGFGRAERRERPKYRTGSLAGQP